MRALGIGRLDVRQLDVEGRAPRRTRFGANPAVVLAHDAVGDGETESRSLPHRLGGKEGIEDTGEMLVSDARSGVRHAKHDQLPPFRTEATDARRRDGDPALSLPV